MKKVFCLIIVGLALTSQNTWALPASQCKTMGKNLSVQSSWRNTKVTYIDCVSEQPLTIASQGGLRHSIPLPPIPAHAVLPNSKVTVAVRSRDLAKKEYWSTFYGNIGNGVNIACLSSTPSCTCNGNPCATQ